MFHSLGKYILLLRLSFRKPEKFAVYWAEVMREMVSVGIGSLGIISIISVFIGAATTIQVAFQLNSPLVPRTIAGSIARDSNILEFSPTISALVLAGRVGSSMASQIGTMRVTEQIDALEIMGVNAPGYLISPKIIASMTMIPLLVIVAIALALTGGYIACLASGDVSPADYLIGVHEGFDGLTVRVALVKAVVFGFLIASICSYQGVVYSCVMILFADLVITRLML
jgi:phospholipid/cholesterol/gamma-HCH transport system permease protein